MTQPVDSSTPGIQPPYTIVVEPCEVMIQEEKEALLAKNQLVLKYNKQAESKEEYIINRERKN